MNDGQVLTTHDTKAALVDNLYSNLLGSIWKESALLIYRLFLRMKFGTPSNDCADKAPGLDGFTGHFYQACWETIKVDVMRAISNICNRNFLNFGRLNISFITLIPKMEVDVLVKDFRPISLVHSFTKLVTKLLANWLATKLDSMVSPC